MLETDKQFPPTQRVFVLTTSAGSAMGIYSSTTNTQRHTRTFFKVGDTCRHKVRVTVPSTRQW
jgi:hypothetical protein